MSKQWKRVKSFDAIPATVAVDSKGHIESLLAQDVQDAARLLADQFIARLVKGQKHVDVVATVRAEYPAYAVQLLNTPQLLAVNRLARGW